MFPGNNDGICRLGNLQKSRQGHAEEVVHEGEAGMTNVIISVRLSRGTRQTKVLLKQSISCRAKKETTKKKKKKREESVEQLMIFA